MKTKIENLPKEFRKRGLRKRLLEICQKNDIVLWPSSALLSEENKIEKAISI